jgi:hypothetical protein
MSEELELGSREKSPESVELTPAIEVERGEPPEISESSQEIVVGEPQADIDMPEVDPKESRSEGERSGSFDMQVMKKFMQQMEERLKEGQENSKQDLVKVTQELKGQEKSEERAKQDSEKIVQELQQVEERVVLNCQRSQEKLKDELSEKVTTEMRKVAVEIDKVKEEVKKWQGRLEREMIGVKQQFEREREEQNAKLVQLADHQEVENTIMKQKIEEIQEIVEHH